MFLLGFLIDILRVKVCQEPFWNYCNEKLEEDGNILGDVQTFTIDCAKHFLNKCTLIAIKHKR